MQTERTPMAIEYVEIEVLLLDARNPRQHSRQQLCQIARSIQRFGFLVPPIVDGADRVLSR